MDELLNIKIVKGVYGYGIIYDDKIDEPQWLKDKDGKTVFGTYFQALSVLREVL